MQILISAWYKKSIEHLIGIAQTEYTFSLGSALVHFKCEVLTVMSEWL